MKNSKILLKTASILWVVWGLVHILAGVLTMYFVLSGETATAIMGIADGTNPDNILMDYSAASNAILGQHGFNLFWIGLTTFMSAFFIWKGNSKSIFLAALVGGLADFGYFLFLDLGGFVKFAPGTIMTLVSASAIILSFYAYFSRIDK